MPSKKTAVRVYLSPEEHKQFFAQASRARLSMSTYAKRVCLGYEIKSSLEQQAVLELIRLKAELGRLGGLLKHELKEQRLARTPAVTDIINEIAENKEALMAAARVLAGHERRED